MPNVLSPRDLVSRPDYRTKLEHHHHVYFRSLLHVTVSGCTSKKDARENIVNNATLIYREQVDKLQYSLV